MKKALICLALAFSLQTIVSAQTTEGFEDDFNDNSSAWSESDGDYSYCKVQDGQYFIEHKRKNMSWLFTKSLYLDPDKDFYIESKMTQLTGVDDDGYGIIFGMSGIKNYYSFVVSSKGKYKLYGYKNNEYFSSREWTKDGGINKKKTANILGIKKSGGGDLIFCKWKTNVYREVPKVFWSVHRVCSES